jgi:HAD superfamily hydrolase (TIGR01459 family)
MSAPGHLNSLSDLVPLFDAFLVDQFGVLHDGVAPYPGTVEALRKLKESGKTILLISNSGKRAAPNEQRLLQLGFTAGSWNHFLTSGEVAWRMLNRSLTDGKKKRCLLIARGSDKSAVDGLPLEIVGDGAQADVVLISGSEGDTYEMDHYRRLLELAAARNVRCLCTNPDKIMLTPKGPRFGAGRIAEEYAEMGGPVTWIGKPFPEIYETARTILDGIPTSRIACVGDSIEHDIAGGHQAGFSTVLVTTGILASASDAERNELYRTYGVEPDYVLPAFVW